MKRKWRKIAIIALLALLLGGVYWDNGRLVTEEFAYADPALPAAFEGFRVVQLSDLHGRQFGAGNARLIAAAEAAKPDLIALTGDFADEYSSVADLIPLVDGLTAIAPVYYVTGNHEWSSGQAQTVVRTLRAMGVYCLENEFTTVERGGEHIVLAGIHDPNGHADQKTPEALAAEVYAAEGDPYWLLLAHRNNLFNGRYCRLGANLTLCGHAHGGIWRLPFTDGLIDSGRNWFPTYTNGLYACTDGGHEPSTVFVSRGLGNSPAQIPRLLNPPQVAVVILTRGA